jgi:hypothetical protein
VRLAPGCRQLRATSRMTLASPGASAATIPLAQLNSGSQPTQAKPVTLPPLIGATPPEIRERVRHVTAVFAVDASGSMYGPFGDPEGIRYAAALSLIDLQRRSGGGQAGVVHWGTEAPREMVTPLMDVRRGRRAFDSALQIPPSLGGNDLPAALRRSAEVLSTATAGSTPLVFVITDGIEDVTPETHAAVAGLPPGSVHMLLVDRSGGCTSELETAWRAVAFGSFTRLPHLDTSDMALTFGRIYAQALGLSLSPTSPTTSRRKK